MDSDAKRKTINNIKTILNYSCDKIIKIYLHDSCSYIKINMSSTSFWNGQGFDPV